MKYLLAAMPVNASLPPALQSWLGQELEMRGIDAVIYTRYILSILLQETADWEPSEDLPWTQASPWKSKAQSRKAQRRKASSKDLEEQKKTAAVECLLSVTEEDTGIKKLVDELYSKLKEQSDLTDLSDHGAKCISSEDEQNASDSDAITGDPVERYHQAFPPLSGSDDDQSVDTSSCAKCEAAWSAVVSKTQQKSTTSKPTELEEYSLPIPVAPSDNQARAKQAEGLRETRCVHGNIGKVNASPEKVCKGIYSRGYCVTGKTVMGHDSAKQNTSGGTGLRILSWPDLHPSRPGYFERKDVHQDRREVGRILGVQAMVDGVRSHRQTSSVADLPDSSAIEENEDLTWYTEPVEILFQASPRPSRRLYRRHSLQQKLDKPCTLAEMMQQSMNEDEVFSSAESDDDNSDIVESLECNNNHLLSVPKAECITGNNGGTSETVEPYQLFKPEPNEAAPPIELAATHPIGHPNARLLSDSCLYSTNRPPDLIVSSDQETETCDDQPAFYLGSPDLFYTSRPGSRAWFSTTNTPQLDGAHSDIKDLLGASSLFSEPSEDKKPNSTDEKDPATSNSMKPESLLSYCRYPQRFDDYFEKGQFEFENSDNPLPYDKGSRYLPYNSWSEYHEDYLPYDNQNGLLNSCGPDWSSFSMQNLGLFPTDSIWSSLRELSSDLFQTPSPDNSLFDVLRCHLSPHRDKVFTCHLWDVNMQWRSESTERLSTIEQIYHYMVSLNLTLQQPYSEEQEQQNRFLQGGVYGGEMFSTAFDESWKQKLGLDSFGSASSQNCWVFEKEDHMPESKGLPSLQEPQVPSPDKEEPVIPILCNHKGILPSENSAFKPSQPLPKLYQVKSEPCLIAEPLIPSEPSQTCRFVQVKYLYKSEPHILQQLGLTDEDPLNRQEELSNMTFSHKTHFKPISVETAPQEPQQTSKTTSSVETDQLTHMQRCAAEASAATALTPNSAKNYQAYWITDRDKGAPEAFVPKFRVEKAREKFSQTGDSLDMDEPPPECCSDCRNLRKKDTEVECKENQTEDCNLDLEESTWTLMDDADGDSTPAVSEGAVDPTVEWLFADIDKVRTAPEDTYLCFDEDSSSDYESIVGDLDVLNGAGNLSELWGSDSAKNASIWSVDGHCNPIWSYAKDLLPWSNDGDSSDNSHLVPSFSWPALAGSYIDWSKAEGETLNPAKIQEEEPDIPITEKNTEADGATGINIDPEDLAVEWAYLYDEVFHEDLKPPVMEAPDNAEESKVTVTLQEVPVVHQPHELPGLDYDPPELPTDKAMFSCDLEEQWLRDSEDMDDQWLQDVQAYDIPPRAHHTSLKSGSTKKPCSFFMEGNCRRKDCKFAHDISKITCRFWEQSECFKGVTCPFLHGYPGLTKKHAKEDKKYEKDDDFRLDNKDFPELGQKTNVGAGQEIKSDNKGKKDSSHKKEATKQVKEPPMTLRRYAKKNKSRAKSLPTDIKTNRG